MTIMTNINRRSFLKSSAGAATSLGLIGAGGKAFASDETIRIASLLDLSGGLDALGKPMQDAITFAVEEINAAGGLLGKQIELVTYDTQSDMRLYPQYAQQAVMKDKVAAAFGGITSASREVMRPVFRRLNTLYFYNTQYEGGVCDRNIFCTGITPAQKQSKHVPYAMNKWGKKIYTLAADYNYGQITADWTRKYCMDNGGQIVGQDFFPLDVTNFGSTIQKIQEAKPDFIYTVLVGGAHQSFYRQWAAAGMNTRIPLASTTMTIGGEQKFLAPEETNGILLCFNYFEELDTPANKAFLERFHKRFGADYPYVTELAMATYQSVYLWAEGVKKAGTAERMPVIEALESGISLDLPSGKFSIDPQTHHVIMDINIGQIQDRKINILESYPQQHSLDTSAVCDLKKNPDDNTMYVIKV
ncbi:transporter substrate-binding protein [Mesorhizobium sp. Root552]|uniref:transporter substrate-binding protein n=1 Tax=Mesorhizobium sp. Root552 TaxID=1736555 RepID=UPI000ABF9F12|nr:transporter substrate-binding protein [Mesorhizobium sp. Root552]